MSAIFALLFIFATHRIVPEPTSAREAQFDQSWEDVMQVFPLAKKTDRIMETVSTEPKPIVVERIMPDTPVVPPVLMPVQDDKPRIVRRRHVEPRDICRGKGKRFTHGGRSWRCRR
jgi:hypothetical protein